jgi:hypothetical protein
LTDREFVASGPVPDRNNDHPTRLFAIGPASATGRSNYFQATASAQQGGAGGGATGGGPDAVAGTAVAPAVSIDQVTIRGCTAAAGAGSLDQLATDPALVDQQ